MKKITYLIVIVFLLVLIIPSKIEAKTLQDMYDQLADLQTKYNNNKNSKNLTQSQINQLNGEITTISATIEKTRKEIKQAEIDIENSKTKIADKKVETDGLIQFLQVSNGGNIYLEYLFDAENYTDFIYRYEVVKQLTNYNSDLIDELEALILDLQAKEKELSEKTVKLENDRQELTKKVNTLSYSLANFESEGVDIEEDIADLKKVIKVYEDMGCSRNQDITTCAASINAFGWKYPMAKGCVTSEYTGFNQRLDYSGGGGHHAIDLDCVGEGTNVYAAADGTIARIAFYDCGGNAVYITHTVNGKKYTTVYMHLLSVASGMYVGKVVTDQTVIGYVGGWSTSTANGGYDRCTTGAHLHFGIAEGHNAWDFNSYSINPREIFSFPSLIYNGGGYFYR
ncbi:MAG: murein hydrolase activator EnvC family protein [Bacilli bacterium]